MDWYEPEIVAKGRKRLSENLRYRRRIRGRAEHDHDFRSVLMEMCRQDILYFFSAFCWLHEPRMIRGKDGRPLPDVVPFIPWPHQEPVIREIRKHLGYEDIGVEKSRCEGMSWIAILFAVHDWIFAVPGKRLVNIGFVSRNRDMADTPGNMSSLLEKVAWELEQLPVWMVGEKNKDYRRRTDDSTIKNLRNKSTIGAYSCTGEVGSGGRYTWWLVDELSKFPPGGDKDALTSTQATTNSRLIVGTPYGSEGAYYDIMHEPSSMVKLTLAWEQNPTRNIGLYRMVGGMPVAVDPANNPLPAHYNPPDNTTIELFSRLRRRGFRLEKGLRSPWYDHECDRPDASPFNIAQELDRDYGGSMYKIFTDEFFKAAASTVRQPFGKFQVHYDEHHHASISRAADGMLHLWMTLDSRNRPPDHPYVIGCDICTGLGGTYTSNSVIEIIDALTMEQVGEFSANTIAPDDFADLTVAIAHWLGEAYVAWEANGGTGSAFGSRIKRVGYGNIFLRTTLFDKRHRKKTKKPGWWTDTKSKEVMITELKRIVAVGELKLRSDPLVKECHQYIRIGRTIEHVANARGTNEGADKGDSHGDRVIALGVAVQALRDRPVAAPGIPAPVIIEPGSIEERDRDYLASLREKSDDDWDDRTNWDLMSGQASGHSFL